MFDLLDLCLFHGWMVDPQDTETAEAMGSRSYNELVEVLLLTMDNDDEAVKWIQSQANSFGRGGGSNSSFISRTPGRSVTDGQAASSQPLLHLPAAAEAPPLISFDSDPPEEGTQVALPVNPLHSEARSSDVRAEGGVGKKEVGEGEAAAAPPLGEMPGGVPVSPPPPPSAAQPQQKRPEPSAAQIRQALLIRQFLEANCSQFTWSGLFGMVSRCEGGAENPSHPICLHCFFNVSSSSSQG